MPGSSDRPCSGRPPHQPTCGSSTACPESRVASCSHSRTRTPTCNRRRRFPTLAVPHWLPSVATTLMPCLRATASVWSNALQSRTPSVVARDWKNHARKTSLPGPIRASERWSACPASVDLSHRVPAVVDAVGVVDVEAGEPVRIPVQPQLRAGFRHEARRRGGLADADAVISSAGTASATMRKKALRIRYLRVAPYRGTNRGSWFPEARIGIPAQAPANT